MSETRWMVGVTLVVMGFALGSLAQPATAQDDAPIDLRVMTFNIRYGSADDGPNSWPHRRELVSETIRLADPDLLGTQETLGFQADYLAEHLPHLAYVGRSRQADPQEGEQCAVFFRRERFDKLAEGHFWLSPSPDQPASKGWDAALPRMATWVRLWDRRTDRPLVLLNTHFDHVGKQARTEAAQQIREFVEHLYPPVAVVVTGDFNSPDDSEAYRRLAAQSIVRDAFRLAHPDRSDQEGTFNGFSGQSGGPRIDWILVGPSWSVSDCQIVRRSRDGRFPSDHFPVTATLHVATPSEGRPSK